MYSCTAGSVRILFRWLQIPSYRAGRGQLNEIADNADTCIYSAEVVLANTVIALGTEKDCHVHGFC